MSNQRRSNFPCRPNVLYVILALGVLPFVAAHAMLDSPNPRGCLDNSLCTHRIAAGAPRDYHVHFPAGARSHVPGTGKWSQVLAAGHNWTPFRPLAWNFRWRAGVCGDTVRGRDHLRGGRYYWPRARARSVARFRAGGIIDASIKVVAHHNGFVELHVCDVSKCPGGDISAACFKRGYCVQLQRAWTKECDSGTSTRCGPIDRRYPGRWYLPCSRAPKDGHWERYGPGTMQFELPAHFYCDQCVLHWYYTSANDCNPPGVVDYFDGPDRPRNWGGCRGQGAARGGVARQQRTCGGRLFPEEYYNCADIEILPRGGRR